MNTHVDKIQENKSQSVSVAGSQIRSGGESAFQFVDNRSEAVAQRKLQEIANNSPQAKQAAQFQAMADSYSTHQQKPIQKKENNTGLPDNLKTGIENLSGFSMDDVKVHYNSDKPAQLQAHAYAQGTDIHIASGQEKHLPHEAWHVVQQKQGRVKPTIQMKGGLSINTDVGLEREADFMGEKGNSLEQLPGISIGSASVRKGASQFQRVNSSHATIQRTVLSKVSELKGGGTKRVFYSTYDPSNEFDDHMEAWRHDAELANADPSEFDPDARYPTNYSYYNTKSMNVMGTSNQGPHSLSHSSLSHRLNKRMKDTKPRKLRDQQILTPRKFAQQLESERPKRMKPAQVERMRVDYQLLYDRLDSLLDSEEDGPEVHELIMRLIQMHPNAAYGKGKKTGKRNIKGHGERKEDSFEKAFDKGAKFRDEKGYTNFKKMRRRLYSDEEVSSSDDEGHVRKKAKKSIRNSKAEIDSSSEGASILTPLQVMVILNRAASGALYILSTEDWEVYDQYKNEHPENQYTQ